MKYFFLAAAIVILTIFIPGAYAENYDFQSVKRQYDQYSPNDLSNPYSQYAIQDSPSKINNSYSLENQVSVQKINIPSIQNEPDYRIGIKSPGTQGKAVTKVKKESPAEAYLLKLLKDKDRPKQNIPLFYYLLIFSCLALVATAFVIIGIFKK